MSKQIEKTHTLSHSPLNVLLLLIVILYRKLTHIPSGDKKVDSI